MTHAEARNRPRQGSYETDTARRRIPSHGASASPIAARPNEPRRTRRQLETSAAIPATAARGPYHDAAPSATVEGRHSQSSSATSAVPRTSQAAANSAASDLDTASTTSGVAASTSPTTRRSYRNLRRTSAVEPTAA